MLNRIQIPDGSTEFEVKGRAVQEELGCLRPGKSGKQNCDTLCCGCHRVF